MSRRACPWNESSRTASNKQARRGKQRRRRFKRGSWRISMTPVLCTRAIICIRDKTCYTNHEPAKEES